MSDNELPKQFSDDEHLLLGQVLKKMLIDMMVDKWNGKDFTSMDEIESMANDILGVFQDVSANIEGYIRADADSKAN
jgi:hypothetical protein